MTAAAQPVSGTGRSRRVKPLLWNGRPVHARLLQQRYWMAIMGLLGVGLIAGMYYALWQVHWYIHIGTFYWKGWSLKAWWDHGSWWPFGAWADYRHGAFRDNFEPAMAVAFVMSAAAGPVYWKRRLNGWQLGLSLAALVVVGIGLGILGVYLRDFGLPGLWHHAATASGNPGYNWDGLFSWAGHASLFTLAWGALMGLILHRIFGPAGATIQGMWVDRLADRDRERGTGRVAWYVRLPFTWPTFRERYSELYLQDDDEHEDETAGRPGWINRTAFSSALLIAILLIALGLTAKYWIGHGHTVPYLAPGSSTG